MPITSISGVDEDALSLKYLLDGVLSKTIEVFEEYNVPMPARRYWTVGTAPVDCEQVVVSFIQIYLGTPGDQAGQPLRTTSPRSAVLSIGISREVPVVGVNGRPPTGEKIQEGSEIAAVDAWQIMRLLSRLDQWEPGEFGLGVIATADVSGAEGGFQTTTMQVTMAIP